jgi:hypothetical protein
MRYATALEPKNKWHTDAKHQNNKYRSAKPKPGSFTNSKHANLKLCNARFCGTSPFRRLPTGKAAAKRLCGQPLLESLLLDLGVQDPVFVVDIQRSIRIASSVTPNNVLVQPLATGLTIGTKTRQGNHTLVVYRVTKPRPHPSVVLFA